MTEKGMIESITHIFLGKVRGGGRDGGGRGGSEGRTEGPI